jgi:transcriptional regulator with XRE-family HTH domain
MGGTAMKLEKYRDFLTQAESSPDYWRELAIIELTEGLCRRMEEKKISRAELARRMGTSRAYVTKLLGGDANFTLTTMVKLAMALEGTLQINIADSMEVPPAASEVAPEASQRSL